MWSTLRLTTRCYFQKNQACVTDFHLQEVDIGGQSKFSDYKFGENAYSGWMNVFILFIFLIFHVGPAQHDSFHWPVLSFMFLHCALWYNYKNKPMKSAVLFSFLSMMQSVFVFRFIRWLLICGWSPGNNPTISEKNVIWTINSAHSFLP